MSSCWMLMSFFVLDHNPVRQLVTVNSGDVSPHFNFISCVYIDDRLQVNQLMHQLDFFCNI